MFSVLERYVPQRIVQSLTAGYFMAQRTLSVGMSGSHSEIVTKQLGDIRVTILPALKDNFMYLVVDESTKEALIVDPVEPSGVESAAIEAGVRLSTVLTTHHHWDHAGGNEEMTKKYKGIQVIGGDDRVQVLTKKVSHNDTLQVGGINIRCLFTPCHTSGHICYRLTHTNTPDQAVFTGDTLFLSGCGRFFEGTPMQMHHALIDVLGKLDNQTHVFCGHEYSIQNLSFAKTVEPSNTHLLSKLDWCRTQREKKLPTVPSTIGEEKQYNPFMRVVEDIVQQVAMETDPVKAMGVVRTMKDGFKG